MVLHAQGGFGMTFNDITNDDTFYTTTSRFVAWLGVFSQDRQILWLSKDDLRVSQRATMSFFVTDTCPLWVVM